MEGAEITLERLAYVRQAFEHGSLADQVFCGYVGTCPARTS